jgi:hypothetical protein
MELLDNPLCQVPNPQVGAAVWLNASQAPQPIGLKLTIVVVMLEVDKATVVRLRTQLIRP